MRAVAAILAAVLGAAPVRSIGQEAEGPDLEFLEYLGSWEADDDEWVIAAEWGEAEDGERADTDRRGKHRDPDAERKDDE